MVCPASTLRVALQFADTCLEKWLPALEVWPRLENATAKKGTRTGSFGMAPRKQAAKAWVTVREDWVSSARDAPPSLQSSDTGPAGGQAPAPHTSGASTPGIVHLKSRNAKQPTHCLPPWVSIQLTVTKVLPGVRRPGHGADREARERPRQFHLPWEMQGSRLLQADPPQRPSGTALLVEDLGVRDQARPSGSSGTWFGHPRTELGRRPAGHSCPSCPSLHPQALGNIRKAEFPPPLSDPFSLPQATSVWTPSRTACPDSPQNSSRELPKGHTEPQWVPSGHLDLLPGRELPLPCTR